LNLTDYLSIPASSLNLGRTDGIDACGLFL